MPIEHYIYRLITRAYNEFIGFSFTKALFGDFLQRKWKFRCWRCFSLSADDIFLVTICNRWWYASIAVYSLNTIQSLNHSWREELLPNVTKAREKRIFNYSSLYFPSFVKSPSDGHCRSKPNDKQYLTEDNLHFSTHDNKLCVTTMRNSV